MSEAPLALITGGTRGVGAAIALALGARGTASILTHRWGGSDEVELLRRFAEVGAPAPQIIEADAGNPEDTERLIAGIASRKQPTTRNATAIRNPTPVGPRPHSVTVASSALGIW